MTRLRTVADSFWLEDSGDRRCRDCVCARTVAGIIVRKTMVITTCFIALAGQPFMIRAPGIGSRINWTRGFPCLYKRMKGCDFQKTGRFFEEISKFGAVIEA